MDSYVDELRSLVSELGNAVKDPNYYKGYHWMNSKEQVYESTYECINDILSLMKDAIENIYDVNESER